MVLWITTVFTLNPTSWPHRLDSAWRPLARIFLSESRARWLNLARRRDTGGGGGVDLLLA